MFSRGERSWGPVSAGFPQNGQNDRPTRPQQAKDRGVPLRYVEGSERRANSVDGVLRSMQAAQKAVHRGRRRDKTGSVASGYVEDFDELRTKVEGCFSNLPRRRP